MLFLYFWLSGASTKQIGIYTGWSPKTVTYWMKKAQELELKLLGKVGPLPPPIVMPVIKNVGELEAGTPVLETKKEKTEQKPTEEAAPPKNASATTSEEAANIYQYFGSLSHGLWLGAKDTNADGAYEYYSNGNSLSYTNWDNGQPVVSSSKQCLVINNDDGFYKNVACEDYSVEYWIICEISNT